MQFNDEHKTNILIEAYKKHSSELLSLEESQQKLVTLLLGILAVGITFVSEIQIFPQQLTFPLIIIAVLLSVFGGLYTHKRNHARASIRKLMVSIEEAMGFYQPGLYMEGKSLYPEKLKQYPQVQWLGSIYYIVLLAALTFVFIVVWRGFE